MIEVNKTCIHHGKLKQEDIVKSGFDRGKQQYKCRICVQKIHKDNYLKNRDRLNEKTRLYKRAHTEKVKQYRDNEKVRYAATPCVREGRLSNNKSYRDKQLKDWDQIITGSVEIAENWDLPAPVLNYAKQILRKRTPLSTKDIPDSLAYAKIAEMKFKSFIKKSKGE